MEKLKKRGIKSSGYNVIVCKGTRIIRSTYVGTRHKAVTTASKLRRGIVENSILKLLPSTYEVVVQRRVDGKHIYTAPSVRSYLLRKRFTQSIESESIDSTES